MTVEPAVKLKRALRLMGAYRFKSLPVVDDENRLQGMITRERMVHFLARSANRAIHCRWPLRPSAIARSPRLWSQTYRPAASAIRISSDMLRAPVLAIRLAR